MVDLDKVDSLIRFYIDQYGMKIKYKYDPIYFNIKGTIKYKQTEKKFIVQCALSAPEEIAGRVHTCILDVLVLEGRRVKDDI